MSLNYNIPINTKRCSNCKWNHDQIYCRDFSKKFPGKKTFRDYVVEQLKYCSGKYLHIQCAEILRQKQLYLKRVPPFMDLILTDFKLVQSEDDIFKIRSPEKNAHFYKDREDPQQDSAMDLDVKGEEPDESEDESPDEAAEESEDKSPDEGVEESEDEDDDCVVVFSTSEPETKIK